MRKTSLLDNREESKIHTMGSDSSLPRWPFVFDSDKAVEAVLYVSTREKRPTLHSISKILYHADKLHLSQYGRPISGDWYAAMKDGPVPSATYDMFKTLRGDSGLPIPERARGALTVEDRYLVTPLRTADTSFLSASELECLDQAVRLHANKSYSKRVAESHGPAWQAADENGMIQLDNLLLEIENRDELREHLAEMRG